MKVLRLVYLALLTAAVMGSELISAVQAPVVRVVGGTKSLNNKFTITKDETDYEFKVKTTSSWRIVSCHWTLRVTGLGAKKKNIGKTSRMAWCTVEITGSRLTNDAEGRMEVKADGILEPLGGGEGEGEGPVERVLK